MPRRRWIGLILAVLATATACSGSGSQNAAGADPDTLARAIARPAAPPDVSRLPILFVPGNLGSGDQFDVQAQRFASNGYPADRITALDYDASVPDPPQDQIFTRIDAEITRLLNLTGRTAVDLVAQAEGAELAVRYLASTPERAARVAHLVSVAGPQPAGPPGAVRTLAVWGTGDPTRRIDGAQNARFPADDRAELLTSAGTFKQMYRFLTGQAPFTTEVTAQSGPIELAGRAVLYPANTGAGPARLELYRVDPLTGRRLPQGLVGFVNLPPDGTFGPLRADGTASYEFAVIRPGEPVHHFYYEPFRRSDRLIRLLTSRPAEEIGGGMTVSPKQTDLVVIRGQEWRGDQGAASDQLAVDGQNVLNAANAPRSKLTLRVFLFDQGADGRTDLAAPLPNYFTVGFVTGADLFLPAGNRSIAVTVTPRGVTMDRATVHVPAWPSDTDRVTLRLRDDTGG
ncbi:lipase [Frankia sp. R82]|uniref:lipase n=1 Tax=Frankia sp. R82 TaxID=2950553 RepID=UPI0020441D83|nr:lipase [Frankia sp. R82]MCM3887555.1 lipase [Frankia sp. R82]